MGTFTISRGGEDKAAHHQCLPKYGLLINPSWPAAFWKYLSKGRGERGRVEGEGDMAYCIASALDGLELEDPSSAMIIKSMFLYTKSITQQIKRKLLEMLPWRKDISISVIQDLEWPPLAVRNSQMFSTNRWIRC